MPDETDMAEEDQQDIGPVTVDGQEPEPITFPAQTVSEVPVRMPVGYQGADPVLRNPEFSRFVPPGFTGNRFQLPADNQTALHNYVTAKADAAARERNQQMQLQRIGRIEDAAKATASARKFMAMRQLGNDYSAAIASGIPHDQAIAHALATNPDAIASDPGLLSIMGRASRPVRQQQPARYFPATKDHPAFFQNPNGTIQQVHTPAAKKDPVDEQTAAWTNHEITLGMSELKKLDQQIEALGSPLPRSQEGTYTALKKKRDDLSNAIEDKKRTVLELKKGGVNVIPTPKKRYRWKDGNLVPVTE